MNLCEHRVDIDNYSCGLCRMAGQATSNSASFTGYEPTKLGEACNLEQLRQIIDSFVGECPIRFDNKGPIEIYYSNNGDGGTLIFR